MMLRRFLALPRGDRRLVLRALLSHSVIIAGLHVMPFNRVRRLVRAIARHRTTDRAADTMADRIAWAVAASATVLGGFSTCLSAALTEAALLQRIGHPAIVAIGVRPGQQGALNAHAWVEHPDAAAVGPDSASDFAVLVRLDEGESTT
jgi:hypothetical protein